MSADRGVSRRGFVRGIAGTAAAPAAVAGLTGASARNAPTDVSVAATVVRVSHSRTTAHALRIGVRASIQAQGSAMDGIVLVVDPVPFAASSDEIKAAIASSVQDQVSNLLKEREEGVTTNHVAVRVFGGVL